MNLSKTGIVRAVDGTQVTDGTLYNYTIDGGTVIGEYIKVKATNPAAIQPDTFVTNSNGATGIVMSLRG